jgi:hypothetical protein
MKLVSEYFFFRRSESLRRSVRRAAVPVDVLATQEDGWLPSIVNLITTTEGSVPVVRLTKAAKWDDGFHGGEHG